MVKAIKALGISTLLVLAATTQAWAGRADPFKGVYDILERKDTQAGVVSLETPFFLFDADTLENIWAKYSNSPYPANLEPYRKEPSIIAGFSDRPTLYLNLEKSIFFGNGYISIPGDGNDRLEMRRRFTGEYDMAVREGNVLSMYVLAAPRPLPAPESR
jgi:hypothetical protein